MSISNQLCARDVMRRTFVTAEPEDTIGETAEKLAAADAGSALVVESGDLVGILTSRDVMRTVAERAHPSEARVRAWMTADPTSVSPDTPIDEAAEAMLAGGFHHVPVVEGGRPVGVIGFRTVVGSVKTGLPGW